MPVFEFVVEGPAVSLRASIKSRRRYQKWIATVRAAAQNRWAAPDRPTRSRVEVTISIGLATLAPEEGAPALLKRADQALYRAKRDGRNRVVPDAA